MYLLCYTLNKDFINLPEGGKTIMPIDVSIDDFHIFNNKIAN